MPFTAFLDNEFGIFFEIFGRRGQPNASRIARMTDILLVRELLPGQSHLSALMMMTLSPQST